MFKFTKIFYFLFCLSNHLVNLLGLDIKVLDADKNEIDLRQTYEEDDEYGQAAGEDTFEYVARMALLMTVSQLRI